MTCVQALNELQIDSLAVAFLNCAHRTRQVGSEACVKDLNAENDSREQLKKRCSERKNVTQLGNGWIIVVKQCMHLRRGIARISRRSRIINEDRWLSPIYSTSGPKVRQLHSSACYQEKIRWFDIPMHDALSMDSLNCFAHFAKRDELLFRIPFSTSNNFGGIGLGQLNNVKWKPKVERDSSTSLHAFNEFIPRTQPFQDIWISSQLLQQDCFPTKTLETVSVS